MSPDNTRVILVGSITYAGMSYMPLLILNANTGAIVSSNAFIYAIGSQYYAADALYFASGTDSLVYLSAVRSSTAMFVSQIYNSVGALTRNWVYTYNFNEGSAKTSGMYATDSNTLYAYLQTTTGSPFYFLTITFTSSTTGTLLARKLTGFSGNGNSLNAAAFLSPTLHYYVARTVALKDPYGNPINFSPVVTAFMNSDPSVSCFNSVDVETTYTLSNEAFTLGTLSDNFPYISNYQITNHGSANL